LRGQWCGVRDDTEGQYAGKEARPSQYAWYVRHGLSSIVDDGRI
jgi:hypothetical protein